MAKVHLHRKAITWLHEVYHILRGTISQNVFQINKEPPKHYLGYVVAKKVPVIIVPGIGGTWSYMKKLGDEISLQGHPVHIVPELHINLFDIPRSAQILRNLFEQLFPLSLKRLTQVRKHALAIRNLMNDRGIKGAIIVAHSKCGLIGKYFLIHHNEGKEVIGMIAIATPFSGSVLAKLVPHNAFRELRADSEVILDLQTHPEVDHLITSIYPEYDNMIVSEKGSHLEGAAENIELPMHGHNLIFSHKVLHKTVLEVIDKITRKVDKTRHKKHVTEADEKTFE